MTSGPGGSGGAGTGGVDGRGGAATGGGSGGIEGSGGASSGGAGGAASAGHGGLPGDGAAPPTDASTGGKGGSGGGAGGTASGGTGAPACPGLFCEDFESGKFDPTVWDVKTFGSQTATVQDKMVAHGKYAAQFHGNPNLLSYDLIVTKNLPVGLRGHHFGRAYFYASANRPTGHLTLVFSGTNEVPDSRKYLEVAETDQKWQLTWVKFESAGANSASGGPSTQETYSIGDSKSPDSPAGKWVCLEWEFNDAPDQVRVFVDGGGAWSYAPISFQNASSGLVGGFADVSIGYYIWHPGPAAFDVYYDDIVLDTKRVGCLP
jgi:hypothetical protein